MWIVFEGPDCVGKSTIIRKVSEKLREKNVKIYVTSEPSESKIGQLIRNWLLRENIYPAHIYALLFTADRYYHYFNVVRKKLEEGYVVLQERYKISTIVYQSLMGVDEEWIENLNKYLPEPDITIILDAEPKILSERLRVKSSREIFENIETIIKIREKYLKIAKKKAYTIIRTDIDLNNVVSEVYNIIISRLKVQTRHSCS